MLEPPHFKGYKPWGISYDRKPSVELLFEEYEALKLADYQLKTHEQAGKIMGVSRATFARIYENARQKIAKAMVETRAIRTSIGDIYFDKSWYQCNDCNERFTPKEQKKEDNCPSCESTDVTRLKG